MAPTRSSAAPDRTWLPAAALATTLLLWSSAFVAIRQLGHDVSPGALSLGRLLIAGAALGYALARVRRVRPQQAGRQEVRRRWVRPDRREIGLLLGSGVGWFGVYNLALNASERRIDAASAAMVVQVGPLLIALLAVLFLGERLTGRFVAGMLVAALGVVVIGEAMRTDSAGDLGDVLLALVAAATFAVGVVCQKLLLRRLTALEVTTYSCWIGAAVCLPWAGDLADAVGAASPGTLLLIGYLGLFPTALAFSTWAYALRHTEASQQSVSTFLVPALTAVLAWVLLDELPPAAAFAGGALCVAGVLLSRRRPRPRVTSAG